ncbi:MAG: 50S ribosomal protein L18 [Coriobacteriia bacterium]
MDALKAKRASLARRHRRVRGKVNGSAQRPRLCVIRTNLHIYAQLVDDVAGRTVAASSTLDPELRATLKGGADVEAARAVGESIGRRAVEAGVAEVIFDRGGHLYHGRVQALADGARAAGLKF